MSKLSPSHPGGRSSRQGLLSAMPSRQRIAVSAISTPRRSALLTPLAPYIFYALAGASLETAPIRLIGERARRRRHLLLAAAKHRRSARAAQPRLLSLETGDDSVDVRYFGRAEMKHVWRAGRPLNGSTAFARICAKTSLGETRRGKRGDNQKMDPHILAPFMTGVNTLRLRRPDTRSQLKIFGTKTVYSAQMLRFACSLARPQAQGPTDIVNNYGSTIPVIDKKATISDASAVPRFMRNRRSRGPNARFPLFSESAAPRYPPNLLNSDVTSGNMVIVDEG